MKRRLFVIGAGAAAGCAALGTLAQSAPPPKRLGCLWTGPGTDMNQSPFVVTFYARLRELGWREGSNLVIVNRFAGNDPLRYEPLARELAAEKVDVIHAMFPQAVSAARKAAPNTPIVFSIVSEPVSDGFVASLARPGGNLTGATTREVEFFAKRLQLAHELLPGARRVAVLVDKPGPQGRLPLVARGLKDLVDLGKRTGIAVEVFDLGSVDDVRPLFQRLVAGRFDALLVFVYVRVSVENRRAITEQAERARLPAIYGSTAYVDRGGLMAYGQSPTELGQRAANYVDKILRGARPADLPVEEPNVYDFVINLKAARAIGLTIPQSILLRATQVIE